MMDDEAADKRHLMEETLDTTLTSSGRPKRKPKPKNYSDEFYVFNSHGKLLSPASQKVEVHEIFTTSTPVKQPGRRKQGRPWKLKPVESVQSENTETSNMSECTAPEVKQPGTSEILWDDYSSSNISDVLNVSTNNSHCCEAKNDVTLQIGNGEQSIKEDDSKFLLVCESKTHKESQFDVSCSKAGKLQSKQPNKKRSVLQEGSAKSLFLKTCIESDSSKDSNQKNRLDNNSLSEDHISNDMKEENQQTRVSKRSLGETVKRQSKKRKTDILCGDSLKENIVSGTETTDSCDISDESRNMLNTHIADSVSEVDPTLKMVVKKSALTENEIEEETSCNLDSTENSVLHTEQIRVSDECNTPSLMNELITSNSQLTPSAIKRQGEKQHRNAQTKLQTELPQGAGTPVTQKTQRRKSSRKDRLTEITLSAPCNEPEVQIQPNSVEVNTPEEEQPQSNSISNVNPHLHEETAEQKFDSFASPVTQKKPRGRPSKSMSQKSTLNKSMEASGNHFTQAKSHNTPGVDFQSLEIKDEIQCASDVTPKRRGRPRKNVLQNSFTTVDPELQEVKEEVHCENPEAPVLVKRRGRTPKHVSQKLKISTPLKTTAADVSQTEGDVDLTQKKRRGRPPLIVSAAPSILPKMVPHPNSGNSPYSCYHCGQGADKPVAMRNHMIIEHSLMWSVEYPEGFDNPNLVIKTHGCIICQKCKKTFRFAQYYKHHQIWCGREEETAVCEICERTQKAMWMTQHMGAHRAEEKKIARLNEKKESLQQAENESEEEDDEDESAGKRRRRKAAKNAIKLMSSLRDDTQQEQAASGDSSAEVSGKESDDDDSDSDDEDDEEGSSESGVEKRKQKRGVRKPAESSDSGTNIRGRNHLWMKACIHMPPSVVTKRLQLFKEMHSQQIEKLFPNLCPKQVDWKQLTSSEAESYLHLHKESLKFAFGSAQTRKMEDGERTLKFGHTLSHNGSSYCFTGGPIWAVEWCPVPQGSSQSQFLAVSAHSSSMEEHLDGVTLKDGPSLIQIWSTGPLADDKNCCAEPVLRYAIAHDSGFNQSISWCPKVCFDDSADDGYLKRLGLFAVACSDGRVLIYCPPQPEELERESQLGDADIAVPVFRPPPALVLVPNSTKGCGPCLSVAWQQRGENKYILGGYGQGVVYLWNITTTSPLVRIDARTLRHIRCFSFHTGPISRIAWNPVVPNVFVTVSLDFYCCLWNVDRPDQPFGIIKKQVHNMPHSVCWAGPMYNGFFTTCEKLTGYNDTPVCFFGLSKAVLYSNYKYMTIQYHTACTWDINFSPYHEAIVTCDSEGIVRVTFLPMMDVVCQKAGKTSWHRSKSRTLDLYQIQLAPRSQPSSTQQEALLSAEGVTCLQNLTTENITPPSSTSGLDEDTCQTHSAGGASQDKLHFLNSEMRKEDLKPVKSRSQGKPRAELFRNSNANAVHKVSLNRNPSCCLWLASGGQSGILRLDNLKRLV